MRERCPAWPSPGLPRASDSGQRPRRAHPNLGRGAASQSGSRPCCLLGAGSAQPRSGGTVLHLWDSAVPWLRPLENMEFAELIKTPRVDNVVLHRPFYPAVEGTLCLTGHHLILSSRQDNTEELWLLHSNIDAIDKR